VLDLTSLQLFVRAIELGSLSKTAEASNLALAAVSRRISLLEAHYAVALLARTGRGVTPTPAGKVLLDRARDIFRQIRLASSDLSDYANGLRGSITLQASTSAITQFLPHDLASFTRECPDIRLDIHEAYTSEIVTAVRDGTTEVGVVMSGANVEGLRTRAYRRDRLVVVAPSTFRPGIVRVRFQDLVGEDFVLMEDHTATTRLLDAIASGQGVALRLRVKVGSFDAVCRMIQSGFGIGVLPSVAAETFVGAMGLRLLTLDESWAERQMLICTNQLSEPSKLISRLVDFLADSANCA
jgi:DNA-binding transcriptional LysR family regulator